MEALTAKSVRVLVRVDYDKGQSLPPAGDYLALDAYEELNVPDPKLSVTPDLAWNLAAKFVEGRAGVLTTKGDDAKRRASGPFRNYQDVDQFLDPARPSWSRFDPELGYVSSSVAMQDGVDGAISTYTYVPASHRKLVHYAPCSVLIVK